MSHHLSDLSPFKLLIEVHEGHNLAIADLTSSDPYVIVYLGDKMIGRTETIYKNHKNPKWNHVFSISLYHLKQTISFKAYDEDTGADNFMGATSIDLLYADLINNERKIFDKLFFIDKKGNTKGYLNVSLLLKKSKNLVSLQPKKGNVHLSELGNVFNSPLERIIRRHFSLLIREDMIRELRDVILGVMSIPGADLATCKLDQLLQHHKPINRSKRLLSSSTWQSFEDLTISRPDTPFKECGIKFRMRREGGRGTYDCLLEFPNRFCAWKWLKWIRVAFDYWNEKIEEDELPDWMSESDRTIVSTSSHVYVHGLKLTGRLRLCLDSFWLITCDEVTKSQKRLCSLDLRLCEALIVSPDSLPWSDIRLQLDQIVVRLEVLGGSVGSAMDAKSRRQDEDESTTSVIIRTNSSSHKFDGIQGLDNFIWIESFGFDFQSEMVGQSQRGTADISNEWQPQRSDKKSSTQGLEVFLYQGLPKHETLVGSKFILLSEIMAQLESSAKKRSVEASCVSGTASFLLNTKTEFRLYLSSAANLPIISSGTHMSRSIFVMCDLVDWNGEPQSKLFPTCLQSPSQPAKSEVHWSDHEFIFRTDAGLDVAHFVRLQLFVEGSIMGRHLLGSAFVKPSEFRNDHSPIRVTLTPSLLPDAKFFEVDSQLLPYLQVICVRTEKHIDREPFQINLSGSIGPDITSEWVSEVVLAGDIYTAIYGEDCLMIDSFDALKLKCIHNAMARRRSSLKSASDVPEEVIVEVFENEQRTMIPPTDFSPENLIRHGHLTDESGTVVYSYDRLDLYPEPSGYEWCNEWCIDLWYTSCDFNGWSYATSFSNLREHLRKSDSISSSALKTVRRRRWTRSAKSLDMRHQLKESIAVEVPLHARDERQKQFVRSPDSILSVCKECKDVDSKIVSVPWNQVLSIVPLTPSTLCLTFNIHRYFGVDKTNHNAIYREVRVELFVLNCPAYWLSRQLDDHKSTLSSYHVEIGRAIIEEKQIMCASSLVESTSVLDTKELSPGCRVVFDIFEDIKLLKHSLDEIQQNFYLTGEESFQKSSQILQVRICRLELYIALVMDICMIPFSGSSIEYFSGERIKSILVQDFLGLKDIQTAYSKAAKPGSSINEVKLFENQLLYLEENADFRIRDAVLKGWLYQGGQLEHYLATIVNEHLVEMAALVGQYFEGIQVIKTLQGLTSKSELIVVFMKHNDLLRKSLEETLDFYDLEAFPIPSLTMFFKVDVLMSWYADILLKEMAAAVNDVVSFWRDPTKDASGQRSAYKFTIPWIPLRQFEDKGVFMTRMPAEVCDRLRVYLENARLTSVAVFFKESVAKLDEKVVLSFSNAIYRLTELFAVELKSCNWSVVSQGAHLDDQIRQLDEQLEWLCSVANDSLRLKEIDIRLVPGYHERLDSSPSTQYSLQRIINACNFNIDLAADHIACIIFRELSLSSKDGFWTEDHIHLKWLPLSSSGDSKHKKQHPSTSVNDINCDYDDLLTQFCTQLNDLREFVSIRVVDYLEPFCFYRLICICAIKVSVRYMCMLRVAVASDRRFSMEGLEARQIKRHCEAIVECFTMIMSECAMPLSEYGDFHTQFLTLSTIPALVSDDTSSPEFNDALQSLLKFAELQNGSRREAAALCRFIETCLKLRRDVKADEIPIPKFAVATSPAKVIHTAAASKYPSLTAFFDTIDYIFPSSADDHGTETLDNEISFHLRLSRLFYSTVPSRDEADRSLFISVFLLQSNLISKQPAAKLTSTMSNLFKDSKASTPTQQDSGHSISNLIPASKTVKAISKTIRVTGLCALNLETSFTRPKAFFKLCVGNSTQTTSIASHSAYPSWVDEEYIFVVDDLERASLMLKLYFEGAMYGHYEVGFVHVSLSTLDISSIDDVTYAINPSKGTSNGMNHFHSGSCKVSVQLSK